MSDLEVHPVAALFPMLAEDELAEMAEDIAERGLLQAIMLDGEGRILDGRNRYAACQIAGIEPRFETYGGDDPDGYALATNITRRHLTTGARAIIAAQAARLNGRGAQAGIAKDTNLYLSQPRLAEANVVLDWAPDLVGAIISAAKPLSAVVPVARARKVEAEQLAAKMARLPADLAERVAEGMDLDEAIAALNLREERQRQQAEQQANEDARRAHEARIADARNIELAQEAARSVVTNLQSAVAALVTGARSGKRRLITADMVATLRAAIDLLEEEL
jgi:hypothetical protein